MLLDSMLKIFFSALSIGIGIIIKNAGHSISEMNESIKELNLKMAVLVERVHSHEKRLNKLERRRK